MSTELSVKPEDREIQFESVRFSHFGLGAGHCTIAYQLDTNRKATRRFVRYACSYTSPKDHFNRKIGRKIAEGRLNSGKFTETVITVSPGEGNALFQSLKALQQLAFDSAPGWKNKCLIEKLPRGVVQVSKDDVTYVLFDE